MVLFDYTCSTDFEFFIEKKNTVHSYVYGIKYK